MSVFFVTFGRWLLCGCSIEDLSLEVRPQQSGRLHHNVWLRAVVNAGPGAAEQWRERLFFCSLHGPFFYLSESGSNEPVRLLREYGGICLFTPGSAASLGRDFPFRTAWRLPAPQVQHKGFDAMAHLGA